MQDSYYHAKNQSSKLTLSYIKFTSGFSITFQKLLWIKLSLQGLCCFVAIKKRLDFTEFMTCQSYCANWRLPAWFLTVNNTVNLWSKSSRPSDSLRCWHFKVQKHLIWCIKKLSRRVMQINKRLAWICTTDLVTSRFNWWKTYSTYKLTYVLCRSQYSMHSPPLIRSSLVWWSCKRGDLSWGENLILHLIYYLSTSDIWPAKRGGRCWEWPYKTGGLL